MLFFYCPSRPLSVRVSGNVMVDEQVSVTPGFEYNRNRYCRLSGKFYWSSRRGNPKLLIVKQKLVGMTDV